MNELAIHPSWTRTARVALATTALAYSAACNAISGADGVTFTDEPPEGGGGSGNASGGGNEAGGGMGGGGDTPVDQGCSAPDGSRSVAVGVYGRAGQVIDQFGLLCSSIQADGSPGPDNYPAGDPAGGMGGAPFVQVCPPGEVIVQFNYTHDENVVYSVIFACQAPASWKSTHMPNPELAPVGGTVPGGSRSGYAPCPENFVMSYIAVHLTGDGNFVGDFGAPICVTLP